MDMAKFQELENSMLVYINILCGGMIHLKSLFAETNPEKDLKQGQMIVFVLKSLTVSGKIKIHSGIVFSSIINN